MKELTLDLGTYSWTLVQWGSFGIRVLPWGAIVLLSLIGSLSKTVKVLIR